MSGPPPALPARRAASSYAAQAEALLAVKRYDDALELAGRAVAQDPESFHARGLLSQGYLGLGRNDEALVEAEAAVGLNPESDWPHRLRAQALINLGRYAEAIDAGTSAIRISPDSWISHLALFNAYAAAKFVPGAYWSIGHVVNLGPQLAATWVSASRYGVLVRDWRYAESSARQALTIEPDNHAAINNLGVALQGQRRFSEAQMFFNQAARMRPDDATARTNAVKQLRHQNSSVALIVSGLFALLFVPAVGAGLIIRGARQIRFLPRSPEMRAYLRAEKRRRYWAILEKFRELPAYRAQLALPALTLAVILGIYASCAVNLVPFALGIASTWLAAAGLLYFRWRTSLALTIVSVIWSALALGSAYIEPHFSDAAAVAPAAAATMGIVAAVQRSKRSGPQRPV